MAEVEVGEGAEDEVSRVGGKGECTVGESGVTGFTEVSLGRFIFYFSDAGFYHMTFCVALGAFG